MLFCKLDRERVSGWCGPAAATFVGPKQQHRLMEVLVSARYLSFCRRYRLLLLIGLVSALTDVLP